jgi:ABC-type Mn2+/Zn2+ transport system permease subunit
MVDKRSDDSQNLQEAFRQKGCLCRGAEMNLLFEPFQYDFLLRSFAAAIMVGIVCSIVAATLWFIRWHFWEAISHAVLPGVAIAYLTGGSLTFGALVAAVVVALGISFLSDEEEIKKTQRSGFFHCCLALGVALISTIQKLCD